MSCAWAATAQVLDKSRGGLTYHLRYPYSSQKVLQFQSLGTLLATAFSPSSPFPAPAIGALPVAVGSLILFAFEILAAFHLQYWL